MSEMVQLTVAVPSDRVGEFYQLLTSLFDTQDKPRRREIDESNLLDWTAAAVEEAKELTRACSVQGLSMLQLAVDVDLERDAIEIDRALLRLKTRHQSMFGTVSAINRKSRELGRKAPLSKDELGRLRIDRGFRMALINTLPVGTARNCWED